MHLRIFNDFKTAEIPPSSATSLKSRCPWFSCSSSGIGCN